MRKNVAEGSEEGEERKKERPPLWDVRGGWERIRKRRNEKQLHKSVETREDVLTETCKSGSMDQ